MGVGWGVLVGLDPLPPGFTSPYPRPNFSSLLPPPFPLFFFRYPVQNSDFLPPPPPTPPPPICLPPPPFFSSKAPTPLPPTPNSRTPDPSTLLFPDTAIKTLTLQIQGQGHDQGKTPSYIWGPLFNRYVHFSICRNWIILVEIWQILYLTLKIKDQCHGQGQTWRSHLIPGYWYACFFFRSNQTIFGWDKANSIFENSRPSSQRKSTKI